MFCVSRLLIINSSWKHTGTPKPFLQLKPDCSHGHQLCFTCIFTFIISNWLLFISIWHENCRLEMSIMTSLILWLGKSGFFWPSIEVTGFLQACLSTTKTEEVCSSVRVHSDRIRRCSDAPAGLSDSVWGLREVRGAAAGCESVCAGCKRWETIRK